MERKNGKYFHRIAIVTHLNEKPRVIHCVVFSRNMWNVWRTVLEENEKLARARLAAVEVFHQQIADDAKVLKAHKVQTARKVGDILLLAHKSCHHFLWFLILQYGVTYTCRRKVRQGRLTFRHCASSV